jgi:hypothetical protein
MTQNPIILAMGFKTPAEVAGIKVQGENKWLTPIQNAADGKAKRSETVSS